MNGVLCKKELHMSGGVRVGFRLEGQRAGARSQENILFARHADTIKANGEHAVLWTEARRDFRADSLAQTSPLSSELDPTAEEYISVMYEAASESSLDSETSAQRRTLRGTGREHEIVLKRYCFDPSWSGKSHLHAMLLSKEQQEDA